MSESGRTEKRTMESASCVANREYQGQQYRPVGWPQHAHNAYPRVEAQADKDGGDCHRRHRRGHQRAAVRLIPGIGHDAVSRPACARRRRRQSPKGQEPNKIASRCSSRRLSSASAVGEHVVPVNTRADDMDGSTYRFQARSEMLFRHVPPLPDPLFPLLSVGLASS